MKEEIIKELQEILFTVRCTKAFAKSKISSADDTSGNTNRMKEYSEFIIVEQNCTNRINTLEKSINWLKSL